MPTPPAKTPRPKRAELERWAELEEERLAASRTARRCAKEQEEIRRHCEAWYAQEKLKSPATVCGFVLRMESKRKSVKWRDWLLKIAGASAVKEAEDAAETEEKLAIERAQK